MSSLTQRKAAAVASHTNGDAKHAPSSSPSPSAERSLLRTCVELLLCTGGIYACFLGYAYIQEAIYSRRYGPTQEKFTHSLLLVWAQCCGNALFAVCCMAATALYTLSQGKRQGKSAMLTSNLALSYMSYPAQALAKSCKLIPVMLMRMIVNGKRYRPIEYAQVLCVTAGIAVFMLSDGKSSKHSSKSGLDDSKWWLGMALCGVSLLLDGFTGPQQEKINHQHRPSMACMMLCMNAWAVALVTGALVATGQLTSGIAFVQRYPEVLRQAALFGLLSALGQACILLTLRRFDSLILVTITTTRKFFTILGSVVMFGHQLRAGQWAGVGLVFLGLGVEIADKYTRKRRESKQQARKLE